MTPERSRRVEEICHAALARDDRDRALFIEDACQGDDALRRDVEALLAQCTVGEFLERPAMQNAPQPPVNSTVPVISVGARLGPYRIESKLGEGGMGEVYRAVDTRLGRAVAVKVSQPQFIQRFGREARAISSLNHPHICTLYDVGPNYLVMELVEGETIAAALKRGPFPMTTALLYASQILAALTEAHEKDIIHRDLKPGNIMIAKSGIKVLDFGIAQSGQDETFTASRMIVGTLAYMAPEQRDRTAGRSSRGHLFVRLRPLRNVVRLAGRVSAEAPRFTQTGTNRQPMSGTGFRTPVAIRRRAGAGTLDDSRCHKSREPQHCVGRRAPRS